MLKLSAWLGILTGVILAAAETALNWFDWQWWPFFFVHYFGPALILASGLMTLLGARRGPHLLVFGWAFCAGSAWMAASLILREEAIHHGEFDISPYLGLTSMLLAIAGIGLSLAVLDWATRRTP